VPDPADEQQRAGQRAGRGGRRLGQCPGSGGQIDRAQRVAGIQRGPAELFEHPGLEQLVADVAGDAQRNPQVIAGRAVLAEVGADLAAARQHPGLQHSLTGALRGGQRFGEQPLGFPVGEGQLRSVCGE
jgi:hypothetical protein